TNDFSFDKHFLSFHDRGSLLAFVSSFITFMTIGGFPSFVFERERLNGHYESVMMIVASIVPNFLMGIITSAGI
ncbi:hypothetical protein RYX36_018329, partial [Vicia faba]